MIELIETHISWIFLTGDIAYKIKKPCHFGFLDFSTIEKRKHFCEEELRLNQRFAPELYHTVIPITGQPEKAVVGGSEPPIDWAVQMKQFDRSNQLDLLFDRQALTTSDYEALGRDIALIQETLTVANKRDMWGHSTTFLNTVTLNLQQLHEIRPDLDSTLNALGEWFENFVEKYEKTFQQRKDNQKVRECHGDLHLGNILREGRQFLAFDGIEFNESLRWIDVASDVGFLVMDLLARGKHDFSSRVLNSWIEASDDHASLTLLPLYSAYRAIVRATVAAIRWKQLTQNHNQELASEAFDECNHYLTIADNYTARRSPRCFATTGVSGSGKTNLAGKIIDTCGAVRLRSDVERKRLAGMQPTERPSDENARRELYSEELTLRVYQRLAEIASTVLKAGYNVVIDATYNERQHRAMLSQIAQEHTTPITWLEIDIPEEFVLARIAARQLEDDDASDASINVARRQLSNRQPITPEELAGNPGAKHLRLSPWDIETPHSIKTLLS